MTLPPRLKERVFFPTDVLLKQTQFLYCFSERYIHPQHTSSSPLLPVLIGYRVRKRRQILSINTRVSVCDNDGASSTLRGKSVQQKEIKTENRNRQKDFYTPFYTTALLKGSQMLLSHG